MGAVGWTPCIGDLHVSKSLLGLDLRLTFRASRAAWHRKVDLALPDLGSYTISLVYISGVHVNVPSRRLTTIGIVWRLDMWRYCIR